MIYLDYSATSPLLPCARAALLDAYDHFPANPAALHTPGHLAHNLIKAARANIAKLINAKHPDEIIFTSGGTEANNTIINLFRDQPIALSAIEHPSLLQPAKRYTNCALLPIDATGRVSPQITFAPSIQLVSVMLANNELGTIQPIAQLAQQAHAAGARFHTDATQALGKISIDVQALDVDYLTLSAHKIGGPAGIGALYVRRGSPFQPFLLGGHQEQGRRAGTNPTALIASFGAAAQYVLDHDTPTSYAKQIAPLRDYLYQSIIDQVPYASANPAALYQPSIQHSHLLPHLLNISFQAAEGESIQLYLDAKQGIIVSTGSACASATGQPSHVLMALTGDAEIAHSSIRFSLGPDTTKSDLDRTVRTLATTVRHLQSINTIKIKDPR